MKTIQLLLGLLFILPTLVSGEPLQNIELTDGSVVRAEVISLNDGIYSLRSDTLGEMHIEAAKIRAIGAGQRASEANSTGSAGKEIAGIRNSMLNDPQAMEKIESLRDDPLVKNILNDQATMRAISAGDINTLMNDPKIKALMENSTVRDLARGGSE